MKKSIVGFLCVTLLSFSMLFLSACEEPAQNTCLHSYSLTKQTATCISDGYATYTCSVCGDSYREEVQALGHTTDSGECLRCGRLIGLWHPTFYVDEFSNPTDVAYLRNIDYIEGTFSNSATTNSDLNVRFLIDADSIAIKLWEYGRYEVKAYSTTDYSITFLDDSGKKHYTEGTMYKNGDRIYLEDWTFVSLLQKNEALSVYMREESKYGYKTTYRFTVEQDNFRKAYSQFYNQYMQ